MTFISQTVPAKPGAKPPHHFTSAEKMTENPESNSISLTQLAQQNQIFIMQL